jgi:uncharacterized protein YciI
MLTEGPTPRETEVVARHFAYLQELLAEGVLLMAGRTLNADERTFGIAIVLAPDEATAAQVMRRDPAVAEGVMRAELFPYRVALWSRVGPAEG